MQAKRGLGYVKQIRLGLVEAALEATELRVRPPRGQFYVSLFHIRLRSAPQTEEEKCYSFVTPL